MLLSACGGWNPQSARETPTSGPERARKNVEEGRGFSIKNLGKSSSTTYEFSTSNPMWRATFDVIDFMPLVTVDYSGGAIITDWYTDSKAPNESLKFTIRFLSNEIRSDSVKVIIHRRICKQNNNCVVTKISSKLENEIRTAILKKAAIFERDSKLNKNELKRKKKKSGFFGNTKSSIEELEELNRKQKRESGR